METIGCKALICDMDGTLIDSEILWRKAEQVWMLNLGIPVAEARVLQKDYLGASVEDVIAILKQHYPLEASVSELIIDLEDRVCILLEHVQALDGVAALLNEAQQQGIALALYTNSSKRIMNASLATQTWTKYFSHMLCADDVNQAKPHPEGYLKAAQALGVSPQDCLVLEDSPTGANAAIAAHMRCVMVAVDERAIGVAQRLQLPYISSPQELLSKLHLDLA